MPNLKKAPIVDTTKILVFKKNSPWGVIKHPTQGNIYKHVLNFVDKNGHYDKNKQIEFINDNLMESGVNFTTALGAINSQPYTVINELIINFATTVKKQQTSGQTWTKDELINSDICAIEIDGMTKYYTLKVLRVNKKIIYFEAEIDIFFTHTIDNSFFRDNTQNVLMRGHVDRYKSNLAHNWDEILRGVEHQYTPSITTNNVVNWNQNITGTSEVVEGFKKLKWLVVYAQPNANFPIKLASNIFRPWVGDGYASWVDKDASTKRTPSYGRGQERDGSIPYNIFIMPFWSPGDSVFDRVAFTPKSVDKWTEYIFDIGLISKVLNEQADYIISTHILEHCPFDIKAVWSDFTLLKKQHQTYGNVLVLRFEPKYDSIHVGKFVELVSGFVSDDGDKYFPIFRIYSITRWNWNYIPKGVYDRKKKIGIPTAATVNLNQTKNPKFEVKLWHPQFYNIKLKYWNGLAKDYFRPFLKSHNIYNFYTYQAENYNCLYWPDLSNQDPFLTGNVLTKNIAQELPTAQSEYLKYMRQNRNQLTVANKYDNQAQDISIASGIIGGMGGLMSAGAGLAMGNPMMVAGGLGTAAGSAVNAAKGYLGAQRSLDTREGKLKDIGNEPAQVLSGNNFMSSLMIPDHDRWEELQVMENYLLAAQEDLVYDDYYRNGYISNNLKASKNIVNSRYYFNYAQIGDVFNTVKLKLSPSKKQIISGAFAEGITIWHYRNKANWKGILNYENENWEISILKKFGKI